MNHYTGVSYRNTGERSAEEVREEKYITNILRQGVYEIAFTVDRERGYREYLKVINQDRRARFVHWKNR